MKTRKDSNMSYQDVYANWQKNPDQFWMKAAENIHWDTQPKTGYSQSPNGMDEWFCDGWMNACYNAVDIHVNAGRGDQTALIYDSPITGKSAKITYQELLTKVATLAGALQARGIGVGDRVIIYMAMVPEAVIAMLACARIGAVHSVVFGGFAANELAVRINDAKPKAILACSCGLEPGRIVPYKPMLDEALKIATHRPDFCVILQRAEALADLNSGFDFDWHTFQEGAEEAAPVSVQATHPAYILYTSGTTGQPKGVVRPTGGHVVALKWTMQNIFDVAPGETFWAASDVGWVVGHSYIVYAPLFAGNTTVLYEGKPVGTPDPGAFWRVINEHNVRCLFTAPTAFRAIKRQDPEGEFLKKYDISCVRSLFLAGERADPDTIIWAREHMQVPVIDHWWQTEIGYPAICNPLGIEPLPVKLGSPTLPVPGFSFQILNEDAHPLPAKTLGSIAIKRPLPPGTLSGLWQAEERYQKGYLDQFPGFYSTGDAGYMDEDGYLYIMARTDDVINVAGHRLSTGAIEEVLAAHPDVAECAVIGVNDALKGQLPLGFLCLNAGVTRLYTEITAEVIAMVRKKIGPVAAFRLAVVVERLPKTRSGKILRGTMVKIANGEAWNMPPTIDDPAILEEITAALAQLDYPQN